MTFPKYLVIFGMLLAGWSMAGAADSTPGNASASSSTSDDALTGTHTTPTHHRRRHSDQDESETKKKSASTGKTETDAEKKEDARKKSTSGEEHGSETKSSSTGKSEEEETRKKSTSGEEHGSETKSSSTGKTEEEETRKKSTSESEHASGKEKSDEAVSTIHHRRRHHTESTETTGSESETARKKSEETAKAKESEKTASKTAPASSTAKTTESSASSAGTGKEAEDHERHHGTSTESASTEAKPGETSAETGKTRVPAKTETTETTSRAAGHSTSSSTASTHHRHHHTEPPPIVVTPSAVPLPEQVPPGAPSPTALGGTTAPASLAPTVETGLPVARPGAGTTATLPIDLGHRPAAAPAFHFTDYPPLPHRPTRTYPWKTNIYTTVFWIGEGGSSISSTTNIQSAWDMNWIHHNGGTDDPDEMSRMSGYSSLTHASTLNPFYIALPFNDLAYPEKAERWLPRGWYKPQRRGEKPVSACKGRWIEIKTRSGRVCYAQWEDVGPLVSDHPEYVFGPERPDTLTRAGLDVSPAVAKYLGFDSNAMTSWRFVDDADVEPGMWLRYDEQAILFQALKEQMHPHRTPRIQDLSEPSPDGSGQDDSEKLSGAAR